MLPPDVGVGLAKPRQARYVDHNPVRICGPLLRRSAAVSLPAGNPHWCLIDGAIHPEFQYGVDFAAGMVPSVEFTATPSCRRSVSPVSSTVSKPFATLGEVSQSL